jgi:hypothetical protein
MMLGRFAQAPQRLRLAKRDFANVLRHGLGDRGVVSRHAEDFILYRLRAAPSAAVDDFGYRPTGAEWSAFTTAASMALRTFSGA